MTLATVAVGLRLAVGGARGSWARLALVAAGVGVGVALLLTGLAVGPALGARDARERARVPVGPARQANAASYLLQAASIDRYQGRRLLRFRIAPVGTAPPRPPGLARIPRPGEVAASPALARLLRSRDGALLEPRLAGRLVATIAKPGLLWRDELVAYSGVARSQATAANGFVPVTSFGHPEGPRGPMPVEIKLVVLVAVLGLLVPTLAFIAATSRVAAAARERRLAAIRLIGATPAQTRLLAAVESLPAAAAGCFVGVVLFVAFRPIAPALAPAGHEFFASDLNPPAGQALATSSAVPLLAVAASLVALRRVEMSPLGLVRRARVRHAGPLRALPLALGLLLLVGAWLRRGEPDQAQRGDELLALVLTGSGFTLVLVGLGAVTPWLSVLAARVLARRARDVGTLIAARRLLLEPAAAARLVSGAVLAVFVATVAHAFLPPLVGASESQRDVVAGARPGTIFVGTPAPPDELAAALRAVRGVEAVAPIGAVSALVPGSEMPRDILVADCVALNRVLVEPLPRCGQAIGYRLLPHPPYAPRMAAGSDVRLLLEPDRAGTTVAMRLPRGLTPAPARPLLGDEVSLLFPTEVVPARAAVRTRLGLIGSDGQPETLERVRNALAAAAIQGDAASGAEYVGGYEDEMRGVIGLIDLATLLVLAIAAAGLLVGSIDSVLERRRPLAVLAAVGTPISVLRWAVLLQTAIPLLCGLALAGSAALLTSALIISVNGADLALPLSTVAALVAGALVAVLGAVALTLPTLSGALRTDALRAE